MKARSPAERVSSASGSGRTINGRENYDFGHPDYRRARAEVMARVRALGWRDEAFGSIDRFIAENAERPYGAKRRIERYGKKYGWIAYHEMVGRLVDAGRAPAPFEEPQRLMPDIDPAFPDTPPVAPMTLPLWASLDPTNDEAWLTSGAVAFPDQLWSPEEIHGVDGGWLLVEGYLDHRLAALRREGALALPLLTNIEHAARPTPPKFVCRCCRFS